MTRPRQCAVAVTLTTMLLCPEGMLAQGSTGRGRGGPGFGGGRNVPKFAEDRDVFGLLLSHGERIHRQVKTLADGIKTLTKSDDTERGVRVWETSEDPHVASVLQEHARVVSLFIKHGHAEVRKNHAVPAREVPSGAQR